MGTQFFLVQYRETLFCSFYNLLSLLCLGFFLCFFFFLEFHVNTFWGHRKLSALRNLNRLHRLVARRLLDILDLVDDVVALQDFAEDDVASVQPTVGEKGQVSYQNFQRVN